MTITDPIADMLTRIRNGLIAKHETVDIPASKMKIAIGNILVEEGFVKSCTIIEEKNKVQNTIRIELKYTPEKERVIKGLKRISRPGLRVYAKSNEIPKVLGGLGIAIVSTSSGVMTDKKARSLGAGGEVLAYIW
ncbi:MAG: 30S ribosomal protein S8 [Christensenellales bacterium]|jgi:small subunit ribosomal protein S8|nr:30S ribosomal protein S8 [Clostridiales bacterium]